MTLGKRMKMLRIEHDLSQSELAEKMASTQGYISLLETNKSYPTKKYILLFCLTFEITKQELFKGVENLVDNC